MGEAVKHRNWYNTLAGQLVRPAAVGGQAGRGGRRFWGEPSKDRTEVRRRLPRGWQEICLPYGETWV